MAQNGADTEETDSQTNLPHAFVVEASGPAQKKATANGVTEIDTKTLEFVEQVDTLEDFAFYYRQQATINEKNHILDHLLAGASHDTCKYRLNGRADEWDVTIDGRVEAFVGVADAMVDYENPMECAEFDTRFAKTVSNAGDSMSKDEVVEHITERLRDSDLWGPGADLAFLNAKNAAREDISTDVKQLAETVAAD